MCMYLAVSGCLLGENIRYNGGHTQDRFITDALGKYVEFVSFCPEHLAFGTPRDSLRLVTDKESLTVYNNKTLENSTLRLIERNNFV